MTNYYVYVHLLDNIPFYIGYGKDRRATNIYARKRRWLEYVNGRQKDVIIRYLATNLTLEQAKQLEIQYQIQYRKLGYPIVGLIGNKTDEEFSKLQSSKLKGIKRTEEQKEHYRQAMKKRKDNGETFERFNFKGKHHTEETKEKIRQSKLGKPGLSGERNGMYGKPAPNRKSVNVYKNGKFINSFECTKDAEIYTGVKQCRAYCRGVSNHKHKKSGYEFYYMRDDKDEVSYD